jgi:outer membrane lipoprotein-sorting protein
MDARALLDSVAAAYGALRTLQGEALSISLAEEEGWSQRTETRLKFFYAAPDRIRVEQPGRRGSVMVSNGTELKRFSRDHARYFRSSAPPLDLLSGVFVPESPAPTHGPVLFGNIGKRVLEAETMDDETLVVDGAETPCHVVSALYDREDWLQAGVNHPVRFSIDARNRLVLRMEGKLDPQPLPELIRPPVRWTLAITRLTANGEIPEGVFEFTPPEGVSEYRPGMAPGGEER